MFSFLKNHPFAVEAHFDSSIVLTFAVAKEELLALLPPCLELDTYNDNFGFIAVAMVQTRNLRPKGFPKFMGNDFFLIGYRIFVRYTNSAGKRLRGLYILKSETDKKKMEFLGNIFTHYNYTTTDVLERNSTEFKTIKSEHSKFAVTMNTAKEEAPLPKDSPFSNWKEARRFAGPLPFTFTFDSSKTEVLIIEGVRENWIPKPIEIIDYDFDFLRYLNLNNVVLANAFIIENIPYQWKKGRIDKWKQ